MLLLWIADRAKGEMTNLRTIARQTVARLSEESLECTLYQALDQIREEVQEGVYPNLFCLDFSLRDSSALARDLRRKSREMLLVVIAPQDLSPLEYLQPDILAGGLLLRPFTPQQAQATLRQALSVCLRMREEDAGESFWVDSREGRTSVRYSDIRYFEAFNKRVSLVTSSREYQISDTLDHLEQTLPGAFVRCHRSFIVRRDRIANISLSQNLLTLDTGEELPVSRTYKPNLKGSGA